MLEESAQAICALTGASLIAGDPTHILHAFTNDTRSVKKGSTFICFVGEKCDGNDFTTLAIEAGAAGVVMCREATALELACAQDNDVCLLRAKDDDPNTFLQTLARAYRKREGWLTVGVTGSVGKTTTRQMLKAALSSRFKTFSNEGNFNSVIGVPLTILNAPSGQEVFVCEMGMDHAGEIDTIASVALPNLGCITNIGSAHIGMLGSKENIARAKAEMVHWIAVAQRKCPVAIAGLPYRAALEEPKGDDSSHPGETSHGKLRGALFLDAAGAFTDFIAQTFAQKEEVATELVAMYSAHPVSSACVNLQQRTTGCKERFKEASAPQAPHNEKGAIDVIDTGRGVSQKLYARLQDVTLTSSGTTHFTYVSHAGTSIKVSCPLLGEHMAHDALFALAIAEYVGCDPATAAKQLEAMQPTALRAEMKTLTGGARLIDDSYNASPASMKAALDLMASLPCAGKKIAVLGEMGELGEQAQTLHEEVGAYAAAKGFSACIFVGDNNAQHMLDAARSVLPTSAVAASPSATAETTGSATEPVTAAPSSECPSACANATEVLLVLDASAACKTLSSILESADDLVLVKGSRFMALDAIAKEMNATC